MLGLSVPAVKSALRRTRATLRGRLPGDRLDRRAKDAAAAPAEREVAARYVAALERGGAALAGVLGADLRTSFPPRPLWYDGREEFAEGRRRHAAPGDYRFLLTSADLRPAVAVYLRRPGGTAFRALALEAVSGAGGRVTRDRRLPRGAGRRPVRRLLAAADPPVTAGRHTPPGRCSAPAHPPATLAP
ncbi:hypothetical protein ACHZ98_20785 [Streptomyces sp. MAR4 CNY-716]